MARLQSDAGMTEQGEIQDQCLSKAPENYRKVFYEQVWASTLLQLRASMETEASSIGSMDDADAKYVSCIVRKFDESCDTKTNTKGIDDCVSRFEVEADKFAAQCN
jgi:hypothetical protein